MTATRTSVTTTTAGSCGCTRLVLLLLVLVLGDTEYRSSVTTTTTTTTVTASTLVATRINTRLDKLDRSYPPNTPVIPDITGPFTLTIVGRFDDITGGSYQRLFDFGNGAGTNNILFGQFASTKDVIFHHYHSPGQAPSEAYAANALTVGTTDTWELAIDGNGRMTIKKNGVLLKSVDTGKAPLTNQSRNGKLLGQSHWAHDTDLKGAILGLQVVNHGTTTTTKIAAAPAAAVESPLRSWQLLNLPAQPFGRSFVASVYVRFDDLTVTNQRIFEFSNGLTGTRFTFYQSLLGRRNHVVLSGSRAGGTTTSTTCATGTSSTPSVLTEGTMALWRIEMTPSTYRIEKNGVTVTTCTFASSQPFENVFLPHMLVGKSLESSTYQIRGVILGLRVDITDSS